MKPKLAFAALTVVVSCRSYSYVGIRCGDGGTCPAGLTCGAWRERPADGLFCVDAPSLLADAGGGASDGGGTSDAGADAGTADAGSVMLAIEVRSVPPGTTHITARIDTGLTQATVDVPRVGDGGFVSVSVAPSPPDYRIRVAASRAVDGGHLLLGIGLDGPKPAFLGQTPFSVVPEPIIHIARGTPSSASLSQSVVMDETFGLNDSSFLTSSANYYFSPAPFFESTPLSFGVSAVLAPADAGQVRFVTDGGFPFGAEVLVFYLLSAPVAPELMLPGYNTVFRYPDSDAGTNGPYIISGDAGANLTLTATAVPAGTTHVTAALLDGPTPQTAIALAPYVDRWSALLYNISPGSQTYTVLISAVQADDGGVVRVRAAYARKGISIYPGYNLLEYVLYPISRENRGTPNCVVWSASDASITFNETYSLIPEFFADGGAVIAFSSGSFYNATTTPWTSSLVVAATDGGSSHFSGGPVTVQMIATHSYQLRATVNPAVVQGIPEGSHIVYYGDTLSGQPLDTFESKASCP